MTVTIETDLPENTAAAKAAMLRGTKHGVRMGAIRVNRSAKEICPVDTGRLRGSITYVVNDNGDTVEGLIGTTVEYAPYVEFGTGTMGAKTNPQYGDEPAVQHSGDVNGASARPFLRPALYGNVEAINAEIMKAVERELSNILRGN
jgi:HK97 gp10 family phage protein